MSENFDISFITAPQKDADRGGAVDMTVSPICEKDGRKYAYVTFSVGGSNAEGRIPECVIEKNEGFSDDEVTALEDYMRANLASLKRTAASLNVFDAFRKS